MRKKGKTDLFEGALVRYADDFIITGRSQSLLVNDVYRWWKSFCVSGVLNSQRKRLT